MLCLSRLIERWSTLDQFSEEAAGMGRLALALMTVMSLLLTAYFGAAAWRASEAGGVGVDATGASSDD